MGKQDESKTLKERLEAFQAWTKSKGRDLSIEDLDEEFKDLAKWFLYGGYISVGVQNNKEVEERYRIYITTVEFYFHCEDGSVYKIEDPIVYHQNRKVPGNRKGEKVIEEFPYFPLMTLHAHASGYDITFENGEEGEKYRASALIRKYNVLVVESDGKTKEIPEERSTYLYDYLNGFSLLGETHIKWMDKADFDAENSEVPIKRKRKNVYRYKMDDDGNYKLESEKKSVDYLDNREWSFSKRQTD